MLFRERLVGGLLGVCFGQGDRGRILFRIYRHDMKQLEDLNSLVDIVDMDLERLIAS